MHILPSAKVVVPESQAEQYERYYPGRVITIDDALDGNISKKRNAILEMLAPRQACWMVDDDLKRVHRIKHGFVDDVEQLLETFANLADDMQLYFGGFSIYRDPVRCLEFAPFSLTKPSYACVYIRNDPAVRYDEHLANGEDVDIYLQYMLKHRMVFRDNRYFFEFACNQDIPNQKKTQVGGIEYDMQRQKQVLKRLIKKWGSQFINVKDGKMNGVRQPIRGS